MVAPAAPAAPEPAQPQTSAQQLDTAEAQLKAMRLRYTAEHPDIRAMERSIRQLRARVQDEALHPPSAATGTTPKEKPMSAAEFVRQKRIRDLQDELDVIDHQLSTNKAEEQRLKQVGNSYQSKVDVVPTRESELVELTRDYSTLQAAYASLLAKREDSKIAANLERRQIGEQFRILDPGIAPGTSVQPDPADRNDCGRRRRRLPSWSRDRRVGIFTDATLKREDDVVRARHSPCWPWCRPSHRPGNGAPDAGVAVGANLAAGAALLASIAVLAIWRLHS